MNYRIIIITLALIAGNFVFLLTPFATGNSTTVAMSMSFGQFVFGMYLAMIIK
jgi:uncharacterized membrane protein (DUF485 family)